MQGRAASPMGFWVAVLVLGLVGSPAAWGDLFPHRSDPGDPKPFKELRLLPPPHPVPLPPVVWVAPGSQVDPGAYVPQEVFFGRFPYAPHPDVLRNVWVMRTWDCTQQLGSDPFPCSQIFQFDAGGGLTRLPHQALGASAGGGRTVVFIVHGNLSGGEVTINSTLYAREALDRAGALPPDALIVALDWPAYRVRHFDGLDIAEKQRRAFIAGYHLARLIQGLPAGTRVSLIGHSEGGRVVLSALHLLNSSQQTGKCLRP